MPEEATLRVQVKTPETKIEYVPFAEHVAVQLAEGVMEVVREITRNCELQEQGGMVVSMPSGKAVPFPTLRDYAAKLHWLCRPLVNRAAIASFMAEDS